MNHPVRCVVAIRALASAKHRYNIMQSIPYSCERWCVCYAQSSFACAESFRPNHKVLTFLCVLLLFIRRSIVALPLEARAFFLRPKPHAVANTITSMVHFSMRARARTSYARKLAALGTNFCFSFPFGRNANTFTPFGRAQLRCIRNTTKMDHNYRNLSAIINS